MLVGLFRLITRSSSLPKTDRKKLLVSHVSEHSELYRFHAWQLLYAKKSLALRTFQNVAVISF